MSYKVEIKVKGEPEYTCNSLRFPDQQSAEVYAVDLYCRWLAVEKYRVVECSDPVTEADGELAEVE